MRSGTGAGAVDAGVGSLYESDNRAGDDGDEDYDDEDGDDEDGDGEGSGPGGPPPGGGTVDVDVAGAVTRRVPVRRVGVTGRPRRTVGGGVGCCSSPRGSCWRRVG